MMFVARLLRRVLMKLISSLSCISVRSERESKAALATKCSLDTV